MASSEALPHSSTELQLKVARDSRPVYSNTVSGVIILYPPGGQGQQTGPAGRAAGRGSWSAIRPRLSLAFKNLLSSATEDSGRPTTLFNCYFTVKKIEITNPKCNQGMMYEFF